MNTVWDKLETVIIGGGIAGIVCAHMLSKSGHTVTIIEADKILSGVTSHTTAHIISLQGIFSDIPTRRKRKLYFASQAEAINGIENLVRQYQIDCDFKGVDGFVFAGDSDKKDLIKEYKVMRKFTSNIEFNENHKAPFGVCSTIKLANQAIFNPIKFCCAVLENSPNVRVIENCRIKKVHLFRKKIKAEDKVFKYKRIIIATGFPIVNIRGLYAFKMYKSFSYAAYTPSTTKFNAVYNSISADGFTYRDIDYGIIIGGLDHRTGRWKCDKYFDILKEESAKFTKKIPLKNPATKNGVFDQGNQWEANDCMTFDHIPYAGRMFRIFNRNAFVITGFGKVGMTNSYACAKIVTDIINKHKNPYKRLFKPTRILNIRVWHKILWNFLQDSACLMAGLFSSRKRRCPHMGCRLKLNPNTKTYDCPCHGSRFTNDGDIIVSPAVRTRGHPER